MNSVEIEQQMTKIRYLFNTKRITYHQYRCTMDRLKKQADEALEREGHYREE